MDAVGELLSRKQLDTKPPKHMAKTLEERRRDDFNANISRVARQLKNMGYDPVEMLVKAAQGDDLNPWQKTAVDRALLEYCEPKLKAVEHTGRNGGPLTVEVVKFGDSGSG